LSVYQDDAMDDHVMFIGARNDFDDPKCRTPRFVAGAQST
jgi:hypothetical protein